ncbi:helix-turn-helix domain-containing protein [Duganella sp. LjRoot269]|jgi:plasmid maintenance system antidote protein VapI|uniref:helix-turn-helix domain-containing protein n=1 Tax=Duganella sp. LjRoot269 TaxID=3342305 RepID=UPI003ED08B9A
MTPDQTPPIPVPPRCPHLLLDHLLKRLQLKNDASLARMLDISPPRLSKIRRRRLPISADVLLRLHEVARIPVAELRRLARQSEPASQTATQI